MQLAIQDEQFSNRDSFILGKRRGNRLRGSSRDLPLKGRTGQFETNWEGGRDWVPEATSEHPSLTPPAKYLHGAPG